MTCATLSCGLGDGDIRVPLWRQVNPTQFNISNPFPIWMSTGRGDTVHPVSAVKGSASKLRSFGYGVTFREFSGAHSLGNPQELAAAVHWCLSGSP